MGTGRTDEFRKDAVRIALTSGLSRRQVADDLGVGLSTLNKWVTACRDTDVVPAEDRELARENERLRREIRILKEERDIVKKPPSSSRAKSREVQVRRRTAWGFPGRPAVPGDECQPPRVAGVPEPSGQPQAAHGHGRSGAHQGAVAPEPGQLWP
jgi:transposase